MFYEIKLTIPPVIAEDEDELEELDAATSTTTKKGKAKPKRRAAPKETTEIYIVRDDTSEGASNRALELYDYNRGARVSGLKELPRVVEIYLGK
jgi:hypothetical protein